MSKSQWLKHSIFFLTLDVHNGGKGFCPSQSLLGYKWWSSHQPGHCQLLYQREKRVLKWLALTNKFLARERERHTLLQLTTHWLELNRSPSYVQGGQDIQSYHRPSKQRAADIQWVAHKEAFIYWVHDGLVSSPLVGKLKHQLQKPEMYQFSIHLTNIY